MANKILLVDMDNTIVDYSSPIAEAIKNEGNVDVNLDNWFLFINLKKI
jgi:hypothetical protein